MADTCDACRAPADTKARIKCSKCPLVFHLLCVAIAAAEATADFESTWVCPNCRSLEPKGDNSNTPVRQTYTKLTKPVTERQKKIAAAAAAALNTASDGAGVGNNSSDSGSSRAVPPPEQEQSPSEMALILNEIRLLRQDMCNYKQQIQEVVANCNRRLDEFDKSMFATAHKIAELEVGQYECARTSEHVAKLEETFDHQMQASLRNEVEIVGIPETQNENLTHLVQVIGAKVGDQLQESDIDWVDRVGPRSSKNGNKDDQRARLVVVHFLRRSIRDSFLKAVKSRRNLTSSDINFNGTASKIYVNERLTKSRRQLFQEARRRSKLLGVTHCWTKHGTIFTRKEEGRPAIPIRNQADLDRQLTPSVSGARTPPTQTSTETFQ